MIHKQMDDDKDGGIEVDESDEVGVKSLHLCIHEVCLFFPPVLYSCFLCSSTSVVVAVFLNSPFPQPNVEGKSNF